MNEILADILKEIMRNRKNQKRSVEEWYRNTDENNDTNEEEMV